MVVVSKLKDQKTLLKITRLTSLKSSLDDAGCVNATAVMTRKKDARETLICCVVAEHRPADTK
jgi:hypothetical protein